MRYLFLILFIFLQACSDKKEANHVLTVSKKENNQLLFYTGSVQPIQTRVIPCPADGVVVEMPFEYGEEVKDKQLLFVLSSAKFLTDYKTALMNYVKAKNEFDNANTQLKEAEFLHKNELISDDDFKMKKSSYYAAQLSLLQAKDALKEFSQQAEAKQNNIYDLSIADVDKITQALPSAEKNLRVTSPIAGTVLGFIKGEEDSKKILKGDAVKQGDVLAVIGDMSGIAIHIKVNELSINQLHAGQKVKVSGVAFQQENLLGQIKRVDKQGETSNGGLPFFNVEIVVPHLTAAQQKSIHAGMSAKVEIEIKGDSNISIPIKAIQNKNGLSYVTLANHKQRLVKTGDTSLDKVIILEGLNEGDKIVLAN